MDNNNLGFACLFDMDGTLVNNMGVHREAWFQYVEALDIDIDKETFLSYFGKTNRDLLTYIYDGKITEEQIQLMAYAKEGLYRQLYAPLVKGIHGLVPFLSEMQQQQVPMAVGTMACSLNAQFVIQRLGIEKYFKVVIDEGLVTKGKPDPEVYLTCAQQLGIPPERCIVFEDSNTGIQAGKNAGMKVVALTTTHSAEELTDVDLVINDYSELSLTRLAQLFRPATVAL